ncbi:MAG: hypothetical protein ACI4DU_10380 [Lachnospiraceae bacterium]
MPETLKQAFTTATTTIKTDMVDMAEVALPAGMAIAGLSMAISFGISLFRRFAH